MGYHNLLVLIRLQYTKYLCLCGTSCDTAPNCHSMKRMPLRPSSVHVLSDYDYCTRTQVSERLREAQLLHVRVSTRIDGYNENSLLNSLLNRLNSLLFRQSLLLVTGSLAQTAAYSAASTRQCPIASNWHLFIQQAPTSAAAPTSGPAKRSEKALLVRWGHEEKRCGVAVFAQCTKILTVHCMYSTCTSTSTSLATFTSTKTILSRVYKTIFGVMNGYSTQCPHAVRACGQ